MARRRWNQYPPYVPVSQRRNKNRKVVKSLIKDGHTPRPAVVTGKGREIAKSFWGHAWCTHLSTFSDYSNRLPRGRSYLRHGAVVDLRIEPGQVTGLVSGTELYSVHIDIKTLDDAPWQKIRQACSGQVGSLLELLQGNLSDEVMTIVVDRDTGLLPKPAEISFDCSCPDWAVMCKHVAAVLFGVGVRLDEEPELLFLLRGVDPDELITGNLDLSARKSADGDSELSAADLGSIFGIELDELPVDPATGEEMSPPEQGPAPTPETRPSRFESTGPIVASLRMDFGYSREEFADIMDVSVASIVRWESVAGRVGMRDLYRRRLEHIFDIRSELLGAAEETAPSKSGKKRRRA